MRYLVLIVLLFVLPGPGWAQEGRVSDPPARAEPTASFLLKWSEVAGADRLFMGGGVALVFGDRFAVGGAGLALMEDVELANTGFDLGAGYGGVTFRAWEPLTPRINLEASLLLGAGHAEVRNILSGREEGSDNFVAVEPEVSFTYSALPWLFFGVSSGYRMVWAVEDLPTVAVEDLRSFTASFVVRLRGH